MNEILLLLPVVLAIVLTEVMLSLDNAVVLANMVKHLPKPLQKKALTYWIFWAYLFRGISLFFIVWLASIAWIKLLWGAYLLFVVYKYFSSKSNEWWAVDSHYWFWWTVVLVELMDMVFSIDNVLWAVAFSDVLWVVIMWVFIGILAIRFAAWKLIVLLEKYPKLELAAHLVIMVLWVKLIWSYFYPHFFETAVVSIGASVLTFAIFWIALLFKNK